MEEKLTFHLSELQIDRAVIFTEFFGANSFAGQHDPNDEKKLIVIDLEIDNVFLTPDKFEMWNVIFKGVPFARLIYTGRYDARFIENVRKGHFKVNEGVVCKYAMKDGSTYMTKIKTDSYQQKLKERFDSNWKDYWE